MSETNIEIEQQLDKLAALCCESLRGDHTFPSDASTELLNSLLMSGFVRKDDRSLVSELETRVKKDCPEPAMHRGGALSSLSKKLQAEFDDLASSRSKQPDGRSEPKTANVSSATDA